MHTDFDVIDTHLLQPFGLTLPALQSQLDLFQQKQIDFGDLYLQKSFTESWAIEDDVVKHGSFNIAQGVGARAVVNGQTGFAYADDLQLKTIQQLVSNALYLLKNSTKNTVSQKLYTPEFKKIYPTHSPILAMPAADKVALLKQMNAYAKALDKRIEKVSISLVGSFEIILLLATDGLCAIDLRPLVRMSVTIQMCEDEERQTFSAGGGGRYDYQYFIEDDYWKTFVDEAYSGVKDKLKAKPAPSGKMPVVLGSGWPAVLLHEAVGHGLEGDFNRKKTSHFSDKIGQQVASEKCTIIDEGCIANRRGSLNFDDEGTPTQRTVLIEKGVLKGYMHDRISAKAFDVLPTGNGRRESYAHLPMPRMTNTYMLPGCDRFEDMIASIDHGIYATHFNGGQVDITSGQFVFVMDQAYLIKNGKIQHPVKGASLIGHGPEVMQKISMVADDLALDKGVGTCGKDGQSVPVGVGQPSLKIDEIIVGGQDSF
ncbi:metalloprotease TldD [Facilibium subflavum]|uniref:metalloprotease TldD n=1 Tax=Facilibium subflavum TaxID=2219058 RepID=UPI000E65E448|nr:metalloprotease TldD [Facilibium subflavum]